MSKVRRATHAGTWYTENREELNAQLTEWLSKAKDEHKPARAIIAPHAGYYYCGACGAHAYRQVDPTSVKRVFILGPSHHVRITGCALSCNDTCQTPLYDLPIDKEIYDKLYATGAFETMSQSTDEDEHSIEMHLPYIAKVMESRRSQFTIVPILVGSLTTEKEQQYGAILAPFLASPDNLFIVSSDFCHWGKRFSYTFYDKSSGKIWQSIEALDRMGMNLIEKMNPDGFASYLRDFQNTICGRHPIGVLLNAIHCLRQNGNSLKMNFRFLQYAQSSQCCSFSDSSVSYASGSLVVQ